MDIKIIKRDKTIEEWSSDKLLSSLLSAGVALSEAKAIEQQIELYILKLQNGKPIESSKIKSIVAKFLENDYPAEASQYSNFKK
jgi:ATP cone domain.